jgi:membrane fusion protein, heavy metal efflux system
MKFRLLLAGGAFAVAAQILAGGEGPGHMHGPDGRHIAAPSSAAVPQGTRILSHHDLRIEGPDGEAIVGADVHSVIHRRGNPQEVIHREHNAYEPENEVYGSHMMYTEPGEYTILERVTLPDKRELTVEFPIWVPDPAALALEEEHHHGPSWFLIIGGVLLGFGALYGAYRLGANRATAGGAALLLAFASIPSRAWAQDEPGHLHGPDGRHIVAPGAFGSGAGTPLRAYPTADFRDSATQKVGDIEFTLSIENEEIELDPDVVPMDAEQAKTIGLQVAVAEVVAGSRSLITTGQVRANPNGVITVTARVSGRVVEVGVTPGDDVRAGQLVAVIDSPEVVEAQSELRRAEAEAAQAKAGFARSRADVEAAGARLQNAQAALARQRAMASTGEFENPSLESARSQVAAAAGELREEQSAHESLLATARRLRQGLEAGVVARNEVERAEAAADQARIRVETSERRLGILRESLNREQRIQSQGLRNEREIQQAEADVRVASAGVTAARSGLAEARAVEVRAGAAVNSARARLAQMGAGPTGSRVAVRAAIGGEVESRPVNVGETVSEGQVLARVLNTSTVWVEGDIFERDLPRVRVGQRVEVTADAVPGRTFTGVVEYISGVVNPETRAVQMRTVVRQSVKVLKPNMFAQMMLAGGGAAVVAVPIEAVQDDAGTPVVFVEESLGSYRRTPIQTSGSLGERVLVTSGLRPGDRVVTQGAYQLLAKARGG